ncbi:hypothetical protein GCM10009751_30900 [Myceligenerans crystallogenes]|uniref:Uncharacterized protein n=1 Tax=Myceligenerans crystallogenes TaxID=316335 RepID=A0ABP4ZVU2_9MICO
MLQRPSFAIADLPKATVLAPLPMRVSGVSELDDDFSKVAWMIARLMVVTFSGTERVKRS